MMKRYFKNQKALSLSAAGLLLAVNLLVFALAVVPQLAVAQPAGQSDEARCKAFKEQFKLSNKVNIVSNLPSYCSASSVIVTVINYGLMIAGVVAMLFIIVGGFFYLTSAGSEEQAEKGKKILINSILGLVVIIMAAAIVRIVSGILAGKI